MWKFFAGAAVGTVFGAGYVVVKAIESETFRPAVAEAISVKVETVLFGDTRRDYRGPYRPYSSYSQRRSGASFPSGHIHHSTIPCHDACPMWQLNAS